VVACAGLPVPALAQSWPAKPVRVIAASSPGSGVDIVARILAQRLAVQLGQPVVVDNRAGAGGNLGAEVAARAPADGYTLFMGTPAHTINPSLYRRLAYDILKDFAPIGLVTTGQYVLVVNPSVPARDLKSLIALARARPGQLTYASAGTGNATHLAGELLRAQAKVDLLHVPYKGSGPALADVVGGHADTMFSNLTAALPFIKSGKLRAIAVGGASRAAAAPAVPTLRESGLPAYEINAWFGLLAPAGTPPEIVARLNAELAGALKASEVRERLAGEGAEPAPGTPEQFARLLRAEVALWAQVVRSAAITPE
jgi:tripartite-type tricarboxylate transporter receptor subunit TctC